MSLTPADVAVGLDHVHKTYGGDQPVVALDDVSAVFMRGTATAVMGPSGSGKSTLLHCAAGLDRPDSGTVRIGATDLSSMSEKKLTELRRSRAGFVFQAFNLVGALNVEQNILLPSRLSGRRLREGTVAVSTAQADAAGWDLGDEAGLWLGDGTPVTLRVVALYERGWGFGDVTLHTRTLTGHTVTGLDDQVLIRTAPDADAEAALAGLARRHPAAAVVDTDRLTGDIAQDLAISGWLNKLLIAVLVGYAVLAAANTLVMAALARTRELSLLRLVGVTRRQVKRMVHAEQAGLLGVALVIGGAIAAVTLTTIVNAVAGQRVPYVPVAGWAVVVGGTILLALVATVLPVGRLLRTPPVEGIGIRE